LRRRAVHLDLRAHLLQARSKRFNLLLLMRGSRLEVLPLLRELGLKVRLLLRHSRSQFLHCAVLFEELVEQHRVHRKEGRLKPLARQPQLAAAAGRDIVIGLSDCVDGLSGGGGERRQMTHQNWRKKYTGRTECNGKRLALKTEWG
jgi:hypothetical protein